MTFLDRIKETSTSTGTSTFTLAGAVVGYKTFTNGTYKYCIVNATETEWEVGEGTVTSGVLTRTTIEASSNAGSAVNFSAGTKYVFNTVSAAYVNSLVPYTGATASVNLGTYGITSDFLQLSTTPTATGAVARMLWNDTDGTYDIGLKGGNVTLQVGQEEVVRVVNKTGTTLTEAAYQAVYISGAQGQRPKVALAQGNTDATSASTIGLVTETIANNAEGFITTSGVVRNINTTGSLQGETWADGDLIYLSPTVAGGITNVKPIAPNHTVYLGYVIHAHATQGKIFVKVDNGYELTELHDIYAPSPTNKQSIYWNSTNSRYELNTIAGILGYTPQAAITLTTTGTSGAATFVSNTLNIPQYQGALTLTTTGTSGAATLVGNTLNIPQYSGGGGISGSGTAGQVTYWSGTSAVTGSSNLFWDNTNGRLGINRSSITATLEVNGNILTANTSGLGFLGAKSNFYFTQNSYFDSSWKSYGNTTTFGSAVIAWTDGLNQNALIIAVDDSISAANEVLSLNRILQLKTNGNLLINNTTDAGYRLDINGTGATTGALRVTGGLSLFQGGKMTIAAATTSYASLNIPSGTAPTSPANGDMWFTGTDLKIQVGGSTKTFTLI